jgi:outer membrane lipoprotein
MRNIFILIWLLSLITPISCTVISDQVRSEAESPVPFRTLMEDADQYHGRMVILGGYVLETKNLASETILKVLQVPFRVGEDPDSKDLSQGRFIIYYNGFLDPEVYAKDRAITVAGRVMGYVVEKIGEEHIQYLKIGTREIYLWPEYMNRPSYYYRRPYPRYGHGYPNYPYSFWYW